MSQIIKPWQPKDQREMQGRFFRLLSSEKCNAADLPGLQRVWTEDAISEAAREFFREYRVVRRSKRDEQEENQIDLFGDNKSC